MSTSAACYWSTQDEVKTLVLGERFDHESIHSFHRLIRQAQPEDHVVVDMCRTRIFDSSGLGLLMGLARAMGPRHRRITLQHCAPAIREILLACHLDRRFDIA